MESYLGAKRPQTFRNISVGITLIMRPYMQNHGGNTVLRASIKI